MRSIKLNILFFGATADTIGKRRIEIELQIDAVASQILEKLISDFPSLSNHRLLYSVNQQYASGNEILADGDEIAIFTAVSGG